MQALESEQKLSMFGGWLAEAPEASNSNTALGEESSSPKKSAKIADATLMERARKQSASMDVDFSAASYSGVAADRKLRAKPLGLLTKLRVRLFGTSAPPPRAQTSSGCEPRLESCDLTLPYPGPAPSAPPALRCGILPTQY